MANNQTQRTISYSMLVRKFQTEEQKRKQEIAFVFSNGRRFLRPKNPYQNAP